MMNLIQQVIVEVKTRIFRLGDKCGTSRTEPVAQVVVYAFNQAPYIADALQSVLDQVTDFRFQILVHDDASTDGTREIIEQIAKQNPGRMDCVLQDENQYSQGRRIIQVVWPYLRGDFVALLDGDDLWTDERKLDRQVKFLMDNTDCSICHCKIAYLAQEENRVIAYSPPFYRRRKLDVSAMATGNFVHTSAMMFRRSAIKALPDGFDNLGFGDYALFALIARNGKIGYLPESMAVYRVHGSNNWAGRSSAERIARTQEVQQFIYENLEDEQVKALWRHVRDHSLIARLKGAMDRWSQVKSKLFQ